MNQVLQRAIVALLLFFIAFGLVASSQRQQGIVRDEDVYMRYGSQYAKWWKERLAGSPEVAGKEGITKYFGGEQATANNREHPPLMKTLFGFSEALLHDRLGWTSETTAYRLPTVFLNAVLIALVFLFVVPIWGTYAAVVSALLLLFLPRAFFHAGLATFDAPIVTFWFGVLFFYLRALQSRWGFVWLGVWMGLALATKHNAIMLPAVLMPHYFGRLILPFRQTGETTAARLRQTFCSMRPQVLVGLFLIGPLILLLLWPWLWFDTWKHLGDWIGFHLQHVHYNFEYLGGNWNTPPFPWHVPVVTTALTVPLATLVASLCGAGLLFVRSWHKRRNLDATKQRELDATIILVLSAAVATGPFFLRTTPIFGAEKHWASAMPSLCIFAGVAIHWAACRGVQGLRFDKRRWGRWFVQLGLGLVMVGAAAFETFRAHPYSLSHYNALAGGAPGGATLGMNRQFWGYSARGVLPFINSFARSDKTIFVYSHDASMSWGRYQRAGLLLPGLPDSGREEHGIRKSQIAIVIHERHFNRHDYLIWEAYGTLQPRFVLTHEGVPLVSVYVREELMGE